MRLNDCLNRARGLIGVASAVSAYASRPGLADTMRAALGSTLVLETQNIAHGCFAASEGAACEGGVVAAIAGYPHWREPALASKAAQSGHAAALVQAYTTAGEEFVNCLGGSFCFLIFDEKRHRLMAGIDRLGQMAMYYQFTAKQLLISTDARSITAVNGQMAVLSDQGIYDYVYFHMVPSPNSIYQGVKKLPAAHLLRLDNGQIAVERYWTPKFREHAKAATPALHIELKQRLKEAVQRSVGEETHVAAFLSGGLDSSTVTGMLANLSEEQTHAYTIGFSAQGYDEVPFARITAQHFGVKLHEYYVTPQDVVSDLPQIAASYCEPFGNSSALPAWFCAKFAAGDGVRRLLAGDGGDELFAGNERYARQGAFERYRGSPDWLRHYIIEPVIGNLPSLGPIATKARSFLAQANTALPDRLQTYNFLHRHDPGEVFTPDFLEQVNTSEPLELQRYVYGTPVGASALNRMLFLDWQFTLADNDLRKVSRMCEKAGVAVTYPMLDDQLVEFSTRIPSELKLKGRNLRKFYKAALRDWLPDATISKAKHGFGLPFGVWMREHKPLRDIAYDNLLAVKKRRYFNPDFIDRAIKLHREGHASYYGELVWILMVLELWLQARETR